MAVTTGGIPMFARLGPSQPAQGADVIVRAVASLALAGLAVIHVVDLPATLGPTPLVGVGYIGIIVAAVLVRGLMNARPPRPAPGGRAPGARPAVGGDLVA